jgi:hypothetical protein
MADAISSSSAQSILKYSGTALALTAHVTSSPAWNLFFALLKELNTMHLCISDIQSAETSLNGVKVERVCDPAMVAVDPRAFLEKFAAFVKTLTPMVTAGLRGAAGVAKLRKGPVQKAYT